MTQLEEVKFILRETEMPYFTDAQILNEISKNGFNAAIYNLAVIKSESTSVQITGLTTQDTCKYFLRIASNYRPRNSGILGGG